jgi:hypothetical protein
MTSDNYRYQFNEDLPLEDIEAALTLSLLAVESLHGEAQTKLDAAHFLDAPRRACVVDATTEVGQALNRVFTGFLRREFGGESFRVERIAERQVASRSN